MKLEQINSFGQNEEGEVVRALDPEHEIQQLEGRIANIEANKAFVLSNKNKDIPAQHLEAMDKQVALFEAKIASLGGVAVGQLQEAA